MVTATSRSCRSRRRRLTEYAVIKSNGRKYQRGQSKPKSIGYTHWSSDNEYPRDTR